MFRFHIETDEGLCVGRAEVEPPVVKFHSYAIGKVDMDSVLPVLFPYLLNDIPAVVHRQIDFTAAGEFFFHGCHELAQMLSLLTHNLGHNEPGNHTGIAVGKIAEKVMSRIFSAVNGFDLPHGFFHKGMASL